MQETMTEAVLNTIQRGDCVDALMKLPSGFADLAFADPPFNIGYEYDVYDDKKEREEYLEWSRRWMSAVYRALKPTGTFWLAIGDEYAAELKILSQEIGFNCRSWVIWYYTFGVNCTRKFTRSHAHLFHFVKDPEQFTFRADELENRVPSARQLVYADARANPRGRLPDDTWVLRPQDLSDCFTPAENTWYFPRVAGTFKERAGFHGCQMPEQLLGRIIRICSNSGDVVLDPFSGSATTLAVAKKLGRRYVGIEISDEYVRRGIDRLKNVRSGDPLDGAPEPVVSAPPTPLGNGRSLKPRGLAKADASRPLLKEPMCDPGVETGLLLERGLIEAFQSVNRGFSLDRVVADPDLNAELDSVCRRLELPGDIRSWNRSLFSMRKTGKLAEVVTNERTEISWIDCDDFLFASEIALKQMLEQGCESVDELLCDPMLSQEFDQIAQSLAPGFTSLQYRWAVLKLRKEAKVRMVRAEAFTPLRLGVPIPLQHIDLNGVPEAAGVYLVTGADGKPKIYAGETLNLRRRLGDQFGSKLLERWNERWSAELVSYAVTPESDPPDLLGYQTLLVREHRPVLNCLELVGA